MIPKDIKQALDANEWHERITGNTTPGQIAQKLSCTKAYEWVEALLEQTNVGQLVCELGSGTGELSAHLAKAGRHVVLVDYSQGSLDFGREVFAELGLSGRFVLADVTEPLPFETDSFDLVWSSGLLEHFDDKQIVHILTESRRISRSKVISLVPNANSLMYRVGKWQQENTGRWQWGREDAKGTMAPYFQQAGLLEVSERSVGIQHSLRFLDPEQRMAFESVIAEFLDDISRAEAEQLNQGYLLVTEGCKGKVTRLAAIPSGPLQANCRAHTEETTNTTYAGSYAQNSTLGGVPISLTTGWRKSVGEITRLQDRNATSETELPMEQHIAVCDRPKTIENRPESGKRILFYGAGWPTNVGNAFIGMGAMATLQLAFPHATVGFASGMPRWFFGYYQRYHARAEAEDSVSRMNRALDMAAFVHCDLAVFAGMAMCEEFVRVNGPVLLQLRKRGIPIVLLGTGGCRYDAPERKAFGRFLQQIEPIGFISRDDRSFEAYKDLVGQACQGIDSAFFLPEAFEPPFPLDLPSYVVANFDSTPEPALPVNGRFLVRAHHNCWSVPDAHFERDNTLISDIPQDYLTLYANADEVHTDRVHAAVATLSYGGRVRFYNPTPRGSLFSVLGLDDIKNRPVRLDMDQLQRRKLRQVEILRNLAGPALEGDVSSGTKHRVMEFRGGKKGTSQTACTAVTTPS